MKSLSAIVPNAESEDVKLTVRAVDDWFEPLAGVGETNCIIGAVLSIVNVLVAVCVFPILSFAVIKTEYVPSAIVELVKFQLLYVPTFVPNLVSLIVIEPALVSDAVPKIEIVETERFAALAGDVIERVGAVVSIVKFLVEDWFWLFAKSVDKIDQLYVASDNVNVNM